MAVELREFQLFQMNILNEIDRVCKKNGLTWYAGWGTLLGAARHQGFIPWDDDIDIIMPHKDYLAFRDACARDLDERFYLQVHSVNPANDIVWQRVGVKNSTSLPVDSRDIPAEWGVCVDIFTLFPCPDPESSKYDDFLKECDRFYRTSSLYRYRKMARAGSGPKRLYYRLRARQSDADNVRQWLDQERALMKGERWGKTPWLHEPDDSERKRCLRREWFDGDPVELPFEDRTVPAPACYREVLTASYGPDWMEIPPESKRVQHSGGGSDDVIVYLDRPYTDFLQNLVAAR